MGHFGHLSKYCVEPGRANRVYSEYGGIYLVAGVLVECSPGVNAASALGNAVGYGAGDGGGGHDPVVREWDADLVVAQRPMLLMQLRIELVGRQLTWRGQSCQGGKMNWFLYTEKEVRQNTY